MFNRNVIACIFLTTLLVIGGCEKKTGVSYTLPNHTDENWINGVARAWGTAFFVTDSIQAKSDFAVGRKVTFSDGTVRRIVEQKENAGSLIVFLDGAPLDGKVVGYPNKIKVTDAAK